MQINYYPDEIANAICDNIGETDQKKINDITEALYSLKAICENEYNHEYYRTFYAALEAVADKLGVYLPF